MSGFSGLFVEYGPLIGAVAAGGIVSLCFLSRRKGYRERKSRFRLRPEISQDQWFSKFYPVPHDQQKCVVDVLSLLGQEIGAHWSQLHPDDRFDGSLRIDRKNVSWDDLDDFETRVVLWAEKLGLNLDQISPFKVRLGDFLDDIRCLLIAETESGRRGAD